MKMVNLTPHAICVRVGDKELQFPPSGQIARVAASAEPCADVVIDGVEVPSVATRYGDVEGLPEPAEGTMYIVSALVLGRVTGRSDVVAPDTGPTAIREAGQVKAVVRFTRA
jgi:hypothetical protein